MGLSQRNACKMANVQRLSPGGRVKPQANGGRKISPSCSEVNK